MFRQISPLRVATLLGITALTVVFSFARFGIPFEAELAAFATKLSEQVSLLPVSSVDDQTLVPSTTTFSLNYADIGGNDVDLTLIPGGASPTPSPAPTCPAGFLDTSFGGTGKVTTPIGNGVDQARSVAIQFDGRIIAAGYSFISTDDFSLVRYNTDGTLDTSFGGTGKVTTPIGNSSDRANSVAIQVDGKIVAAGRSFISTNDFALVRYNTDGTLDTSFGGTGKVTTPIGSGEDEAFSVAIQLDGKIVAAGHSHIGSSLDFALARYNPNGTLDTSFGGTGKVTTAIGSSSEAAYSVAIQPDGRIIAAGYSFIGTDDFALVRYNTDGTLDTSFGGTGKVTTSIGVTDTAQSMTIQSDGRIVAAGSSNPGGTVDFALARYNPDGALDISFGGTGIVTTPVGTATDYASSVAIQSDGKIVALGQSFGSDYDFAVVRYNSGGTLDTSFGGTGKVTTPVGTSGDRAYSGAIQSDGQIVAAGTAFTGAGDDFALVRYQGAPCTLPTPTPTPTPGPTTFVVTKTADTNDGVCDADCSLREAIGAANSNLFPDVIEFSSLFLTPQTIELSGTQLEIVDYGELIINGPGANLLTVSANHSSRVFFLGPSSFVTISGLTVADGRIEGHGGGLHSQGGTLIVVNSVFTRNVAEGSFGEGGGISSCGAQVSIIGSTFNNNSAATDGGGILSGDNCVSGRPHSLSISNSSIVNNTATNNGGGVASFSPTNITNSVVSGNSALRHGGMLIYGQNTATVDHVSFLNNHASSFAGGLGLSNLSATISDCTFTGNSAVTAAGALHTQATTTVLASSFSSNSSQDGGAMYDFRGAATINDCTFDNNHATRNGGAINFELDFVSASMNNSQITNNVADQSGGGIYHDGGTLNLTSVLIDGNRSNATAGPGEGGGGLWAFGGVNLMNTTITRNTTAGQGGGFSLGNSLGSVSVINNSLIANNVADQSGGGIYKGGGTLNLNSSSISSNQSNAINGALGGGGVFNKQRLNVNDSTISGNYTAGNGGGVCSDAPRLDARIDILNSTFSGNEAALVGGAIFDQAMGANGVITTSVITAKQSTFSSNSAASGTGSIHNLSLVDGSAYSQVGGSIFKTGTGANFNATIFSLGYNLSNDDSSGFFTNAGDQINTDPLLGPLQNNGGPTLTHALLPGSPAINTGDPNFTPPPDFDQRGPGFPRVFNGRIDKGSFEVQPLTTPTPTPITPTPTPTVTPTPTPTPSPSPSPSGRTLFDFDGDHKTDISVFRPSVGEWYYQKSTNGVTRGFGFGSSTDKVATADFTGDAKTDIAFWRPSTGDWYVLRSEDSTYFAFPFGASGDIPAPADYDGDGRADAAVFRPAVSTWFILRSSGGVSSIPFGISSDVPVPADYDGDGKADVGIYRPGPGQWWNLRSSDNSVFAATFGSSTDKPVPGDYTGDGKADVAFYRPSEGSWYVLRSEDQSFFAFPFGNSADKPAPADFDGDGKFDATVFRPSDTNWYILKSTGGVQIQQFGAANDIPLPGAFVP